MPMSRFPTVILIITAILFGSVSIAVAESLFRRDIELTDADYELAKAAAAKLYTDENVQEGDFEAWSNPERGNYGTVTMTEKHAYKGLPCRRLVHDIHVKKVSDDYRFIVDRCQTADGAWKIL